MMITISLPYTTTDEGAALIADLRRQQSCVARSAHKAAHAGMSQKEMRSRFKELKNISLIDAWFMQCAIADGCGMMLTDIGLAKFNDEPVRKRTHGGKKNLAATSNKSMSNEAWKARRLRPLYAIGEANNYGNRKFSFDFYASNSLTFKLNRKNHIKLDLPNLKKNKREQLVQLECLTNEQLLPVTIKLTATQIHIAFDDTLISKEVKLKTKEDRVLGIDMNPSYIGASIQNAAGTILDTRLYDLSQISKSSGEPSSSDKSKKMNNKLDHETIQVAKNVIAFAKSRHVGLICLEELNFKQGNTGKGSWFNGLVINRWKRNLFIGQIKKRAALAGIKVKLVNAAYSSTIGNVLNPTFPDPIAASIEIGRRGLTKKFYPQLISSTDLSNLWKEAIDWIYDDWKQLHEIFKKNPKVKYRVPIPEGMVFRELCSYRSNVSYG